MTDKFEAQKDPQSTLDYSIDWGSEWLAVGDSVTSSSWSIAENTSTNPLVITQQSEVSDVATVWLSGGKVGTTYKVVNTIQTSAGRIDQRTLFLFIVDK